MDPTALLYDAFPAARNVSRVHAGLRFVSLEGKLPWDLVAALVVVCTAANFAFRRLVAEPFVRGTLRRLNSDAAVASEGKIETKVGVKFVNSLTDLVQYAAFFVWGFALLYASHHDERDEMKFYPSKTWWLNGPSKTISERFHVYYLSYAARYAANFVVVFTEPRKKDFMAMQTHHATTTVLILLSYAYGWVRVGVLIMCLLDVADIYLHLAKCATYCKDSTSSARAKAFFQNAADFFFVVFGVVFFLTRIALFGYVTWSVTVEAYTYRTPVHDFWHNFKRHFDMDMLACIAMVQIIYCLQLYWFAIIMKVAWRLVAGGGEMKDDRSDEDEGTTRKETSSSGMKKKTKEL